MTRSAIAFLAFAVLSATAAQANPQIGQALRHQREACQAKGGIYKYDGHGRFICEMPLPHPVRHPGY